MFLYGETLRSFSLELLSPSNTKLRIKHLLPTFGLSGSEISVVKSYTDSGIFFFRWFDFVFVCLVFVHFFSDSPILVN